MTLLDALFSDKANWVSRKDGYIFPNWLLARVGN